MIAMWLDASRWTYNLTVEILRSGIPAAWRHIAGMVMPELNLLHPEWDDVPYQVKRTSVRDACRAMSNVKRHNRELAADRAQGERLDEEFAELHFRSRKNPRQSCYIPDDAVTEHGVYHTILGPLRMSEAVPAGQKECRLVKERGLYWLVVPHPARCDVETPSGDGVVALDPGVRTFLTYFSETDCGKIGHHAFGRIQRLCHHLDDLISRTDTEPNHQRRRRMRKAQARVRQRIINLVDELHWQVARWLTSTYKVILLPTFETQDMTARAGRKIRSKPESTDGRREGWASWDEGAYKGETLASIGTDVSRQRVFSSRAESRERSMDVGNRVIVRSDAAGCTRGPGGCEFGGVGPVADSGVRLGVGWLAAVSGRG